MGLAAAYHSAKAGHQVTLFEAAPVPGGMAAHFNFGALSIERFYHFICKTDDPTFQLLKDLGIDHLLRWRSTSMAYFLDGKLYPWGDPVSLLRFPGLDLVSKLRYGALMFISTRRDRWTELENTSAREWITRWCGRETYDLLWRRLFDLKFYEYSDDISAAWIWARIRRLGRSRRSILQEELGYIEGGSETLVKALIAELARLGAEVRLAAKVEEILVDGQQIQGVQVNGAVHPVDAVISTVPTPYVSAMVPALPKAWKRRYNAIPNIGVACVVFKLGRSVTPHFWINIVDLSIDVPGIIEFSNLRPTRDAIVYVPYYMPVTNQKWSWSNEALTAEAFAAIQRINPDIGEKDRIGVHVERLRHAQPVCRTGFAALIPPVQTPIEGLQIADTCFYYPEDRGIAESLRLGKEMASRLDGID
jgi:protoporphyrinogen oxidase